MGTATLDKLMYSDDRRGPFQLFIYGTHGRHHGGVYFRQPPLKYPDEEISHREAFTRTMEAQSEKCEVRITDSGDMLVFHSINGQVVYPQEGNFWKEIGAVS